MLLRICTRVLFEVTLSTREYGPLLLARFCNLRARRETITTVLLCAEFDHLQLSIALPLLFVRWLAIHGSLESARCFSACHLVVLLTRKHGIHNLDTSTILADAPIN